MDTIDKLPWRQARVGDRIGSDQTVVRVMPSGLVLYSSDIRQPDGFLIPLATQFGEGRLNAVIRTELDFSGYPLNKGRGQFLSPGEVAALFGAELTDDWDGHSASFGPWPASMRGMTIVVFDYETTGLDPEAGARGVELAGVLISEEGILDTFNSLINPGVPIPEDAVAIHGITDRMVKDAPTDREVTEDFLEFAASADAFCGHNVDFDLNFLKFSIKRHGLDSPQAKRIDTLKMARTRWQRGKVEGKVANHKLTTLTSFLGIEHGTAHRALDDTVATARLLNYMLVQLAEEEREEAA